MGKLIVIVIFAIMGFVALLRPRAGAVFTWFVIWLYPVSLMYGTLPLDVRFDDVWVVYMAFISLLLVRNRGRLRAGRVVLISALWFAVILVGNVFGFLALGGGSWQEILKATGKALYVPLTAITLSLLLDDTVALKGHARWIVVAAIAAGLLGVLMIYLPGPFSMFMIPKNRYNLNALEIEEMKSEIERRAIGAIGTAGLAQVTLYIGLLALCLALQPLRRRERTFYAVASIFCLLGMGFTASRGCTLALGAALLYNLLLNKRRTALLKYLAFAAPVVLLASSIIIDRILLRVSSAPGDFSKFWEGWEIRTSIVRSFLQNFDPLFLLTGMGMVATQHLGLGTTHNTYIGSFVYGGIPGIVVLLLVITTAWKSGTRLLRAAPDPLSQGLGTWMHTLIIAACVYGLAAENFQGVIPMQLLFAGMVFAEKRQMQVNSALRGVRNTPSRARWGPRGRWRRAATGARVIGVSRMREASMGS